MAKVTRAEVSADRISGGGWLVAAIVGNQREQRRYYGYNKREAISMFLADVNPKAGAKKGKTAGRAAYERDLAKTPRYHDGSKRPSWDKLSDIARDSWERNPTDRNTGTSDDERDARARAIRNERDDAVIASGLDIPMLRGMTPGGRVVIDRSQVAPAVVRAMDLLATRVTYEGGRFLSGEVLNLSQAERDAIDSHLVAIKHELAYQPGTQEHRIAAYAREWAKAIGPRLRPGEPDPRD
jgi:hypothetical protein